MNQQVVNVSAPGLLNASDMLKALAHDAPVRQAHEAHVPDEPTNPLYILGAITLGIPALLMILLIGMNPGVQDGSFASILTLLAGSAFIVAAFFEIKRLADLPSETDQH